MCDPFRHMAASQAVALQAGALQASVVQAGAGHAGSSAPPPDQKPLQVPVRHAEVWNHAHPRAFNTDEHPWLLGAPGPTVIKGVDVLHSVSPALVGVYPAASAKEPYPLAYCPRSPAPGVPPGFYCAAEAGEEFVVRVGGLGGAKSICDAAGSSCVLVNLQVDGQDVNDSCVLEGEYSDVADEVFYGFVHSARVNSDTRYRRFVFEKTPVLDEEAVANSRRQLVVDSVSDTPTAAADKGDNIGLLEVRFATAIPVPPDVNSNEHLRHSGPVGLGAGAAEGVHEGSVRVSKTPSSVAPVNEREAAKHGRTVGVASGSKARAKRSYTSHGICYGKDLPQFSVAIRMRERWWLEAKGILPMPDGRYMKNQGNADIFIKKDPSAPPPAKKQKPDEIPVIVIDDSD